MAAVVFGSDDVTSDMLFHRPSMGTISWLADVSQKGREIIANVSNEFMEMTKTFNTRMNVSDVMRVTGALKERVSHYWQEDSIRFLERVEDIQHAPNSMKRWILANPSVYNKCQKGILDGYEDNYTNLDYQMSDPKLRPDFMLVMNGLHYDNEDGNNQVTIYHNRFGDHEEDLKPLTFTEQVAVYHTWNVAEEGLNIGRDITSSWDASF